MFSLEDSDDSDDLFSPRHPPPKGDNLVDKMG